MLQKLYTNWQSTGNSLEGAFGGYDDVSVHACDCAVLLCDNCGVVVQSGLWGNNSNYNADDTIGDDYDGDLRPRAVWTPHGI